MSKKKRKHWCRIKDSDGCWFCFCDEAGQAAVRTRSLSLKNTRRNLSESLHHDAFEAIGNLHQMFSATITISALYQENGAFASWHPFLHLSSAVHFLSFFHKSSLHFPFPSSRSLWEEQVKSADLLLLIWGFDWYYCKSWLECVEIRRTHRKKSKTCDWVKTNTFELFILCVCVRARAYKC